MKASRAFTLLEVLVAFAVLAVGITLIAAALGRHLAALQVLETSLAAQEVAQGRLLKEAVRRADGLELPDAPPDPRFASNLEVTPVTLETEPVRGLEIERVTAGVSWTVRQQPRELRVEMGAQKPPPAEAP